MPCVVQLHKRKRRLPPKLIADELGVNLNRAKTTLNRMGDWGIHPRVGAYLDANSDAPGIKPAEEVIPAPIMPPTGNSRAAKCIEAMDPLWRCGPAA